MSLPIRKTGAIFIGLLLYCSAFAQQVFTVSQMQLVMKGIDLTAHLKWDTLPNANLYGVSPLGRLEGEVTALNGHIYVSKVKKKGKKKRILMAKPPSIPAPFGVYAYVAKWDTLSAEVNLNNEADLQAFIAQIALQHGFLPDAGFPFLVQGKFDSVAFHIISKPTTEKEHNHQLHSKAKKHFAARQIPGTLLGFYSTRHEGIFTHRGSYVHIHFLSDNKKQMGHLENIKISGNILILLPDIAMP